MWIAGQSKRKGGVGHQAQTGVVTVQGEQPGVYSDGYQQVLPVAAPGGYRWKPKNGQQVLVIKTGMDGENACIIARQETESVDLAPGEVELYGPDSCIRLDAAGKIRLQGTVVVNGVTLEDMVQEAVDRAMAQ